MTGSSSRGKLALSGQRSASVVFHSVLSKLVDQFPDAFAQLPFPEHPDPFRRRYGDILPRFEAARVASASRTEVAERAVKLLREQIVYVEGNGHEAPLGELLAEPGDPLPLQLHSFTGSPGWTPTLTYQGERWGHERLPVLGRELVGRGMITQPAGDALMWMAEQGLQQGAMVLSGRKIAVLGAGAEMAPTRFWLEAGADVLWLDVAPPPADWQQISGLAGRLYWPENGVDLLARPQEVLATLTAFAAGNPIDLGLYAYAPGQARELLLSVVMNGIVDALPPELLNSVALLVSPTTPTMLSTADREAMERRRSGRPGWEAILAYLGLLGRGGVALSGTVAVSRSVVAIQGASYQAAQYLGKVLAAETWAAMTTDENTQPFRISANTAAITRTRSLDHPVFTAAFGGAAAFRAETFAPRLSRRLNGLLTAHDWLSPERPVPGAVRVHGGIHTLPYPLDPALRVAAVIGFARSPRLIRGLLKA